MTIPKLIGKIIPAAATLTSLYATPASTRCRAATLYVCNRAAGATTFRVSVAMAGAADSPEQYVYYDSTLAANETRLIEVNFLLNASDLVRVYAAAANIAFNLFGTEEV